MSPITAWDVHRPMAGAKAAGRELDNALDELADRLAGTTPDLADAACADPAIDPELFFPTAAPGTDAYARQVAAGLVVCRRCPVLTDCRAHALATGEAGTWGGLSEEERDAATRPAHRPAA